MVNRVDRRRIFRLYRRSHLHLHKLGIETAINDNRRTAEAIGRQGATVSRLARRGRAEEAV
jgi:hypothetical protein